MPPNERRSVKAAPAGPLAAILAFAGCVQRPPEPAPPTPHPHYVLGAPYRADGHWFYPEEAYALDRTGIASVAAAPPPDTLTADGESRDPTALTASMQTIQLPAIVEVTNLANGRQITVRVNDRGPADPARLIALSPRAASLLRVPPEGAPVRVRVDTGLSRELTDQVGGGPRLAISAAAPSLVLAETLPPPGATGAGGGTVRLGATPEPADGPRLPDRLPEAIRLTWVQPGAYWLHAGSFGRFEYANVRASRLSGLGGDVVRSREGRQEVYAVRAGPFRSIPEADRALREAFALGIPDATIVYEN